MKSKLSTEGDAVARFAAISVLLLLVGLPVGTPHLMLCPCFQDQCEPMVRATSSCCSLSALPETAVPARLATAPELVAPAPAGSAADARLVLREALPAAVPYLIRAASFQTPLRI